MRYLTLELCKSQAVVEHNEDDALIELKATAAENFIERQINRPLAELEVDGELPADLIDAMLLFFTSSYNNREGFSTMNVQPVPSLIALIQPFKKYGN